MNLYLVQHAEAKPKEEDPQQPLSDKGRADIEKVAAYAAQQAQIQVSQIFHSGKTRTQQTALILAEALRPARGVHESPDLAPLADPTVWINRLTPGTGDLILVGHLPHLNKLAAYLICQNARNKIVAFQNGGLVCLTQDEVGAWLVRWALTPELCG